MTLFDIITLVVLGVSAFIGLIRGFVREVVTVIAFVVAALAAFHGLRFVGPIARDAIDPDWMGSVMALLLVFFAVYLIVRVIGGHLTKSVSKSALSSIDRAAGVGVGLIRGLAILGVFYLVFSAITPQDRVPAWVGDSFSWPLARQSGQLISRFAPDALSEAGRIGPVLQRAVTDDPAPLDADATPAAPRTQEAQP